MLWLADHWLLVPAAALFALVVTAAVLLIRKLNRAEVERDARLEQLLREAAKNVDEIMIGRMRSGAVADYLDSIRRNSRPGNN